jgi:hypothetical protein
MDSILNGFPIPEIYMQEFVDEHGKEQHVLIDGQQRIRACLDFIEGDYEIKEEESQGWGGLTFDDLNPEDKKKVYGYTFIVRILPEMQDEDIRGIFQRLNKNVVALNAQELRQATYWGPFIKTMQELSNYAYWSTTGIFSPQNTRRMLDVEFISELAIAVLHGHQNKKLTLDEYYLLYEEEFDAAEELIETFQLVIFEIEQLYPDIKNYRWKKKSDFYSLFYYLSVKRKALPLPAKQRLDLRSTLDKFAGAVTAILSATAGADNDNADPVVESYAKSIRASSDLGNRRRRHEALMATCDEILSHNYVISSEHPIAPSDELFLPASEEAGLDEPSSAE